MEVLPKRFEKYGLTIHPDKTRLINFTSPSNSTRGKEENSSDGPSTFDLLGFTHYWGKSRRGTWVIKRKTADQPTVGARSFWSSRAEHCSLVS